MDILNETVVDPLFEKELLVASKDSNIRGIDKTSSQVGKSFVDFEAIKRDLLSGENSSKTSNNPPVVCTNMSVVQKNYDVNTSSDIRLSSTQDMELLEMNLRKVVILESFTCHPKYIKGSKTFLVDQ